ncbi:MAG: endolytic transglycosylase MltG [Dysgonamonadaceae bacterium]|jgi:UPF0755 protein|nr:endolytic transglycosylase MltG [Dysgonamonadaceae bacterium]
MKTTALNMKNKTVKRAFGLLLFLLLLVALAAGYVYHAVHSAAFAIDQPVAVYVDEQKDYSRLLSQLQSEAHLKNREVFDRLAQQMKYPSNMKTGKYEIRPGLSYIAAIRMLQSGRQTPIQLTFNNIRLKNDLAERIGRQMMFAPGDLLNHLNDSAVAASLGLDTATILTLFIPNTYEIYWNTSVGLFLERMKKEHDRFWTQERLAKAQALHLSPAEVAILASIVEEETASRREFPIVAGIYLNRLKKGMLLQADPTVKFAAGDVTLKRILNVHLQVESPYNTYRYRGLPPGPIRIPSIAAIDSVLNYSRHAYLYMCAKEDFSGTHSFSVTLAEHNRNARRYREALNRLHIR